jgi:Mn2+/Fe2+ NRAMP family transporter
VFAIALLASGQSSTITGTYAGQYVMQVFNLFYYYSSIISHILQQTAKVNCALDISCSNA